MASGLPQQVLAHIWLEIFLHDATYHPLHNHFIYLHECCAILSWSALLVWNNHTSNVKNYFKKGWLAWIWRHDTYQCIVSANNLLLWRWHFGSGSLHFNSVVRRVYVCCVQLYAIMEHFIFSTMHSVESQLIWLNTNLLNVILLFFKGTVWHNRPRTPKLWAVCPCHVSYTSEGYGCRSTTSLAARDGSTLHEEWKCCQPRWGRGKSKIQFLLDYTC